MQEGSGPVNGALESQEAPELAQGSFEKGAEIWSGLREEGKASALESQRGGGTARTASNSSRETRGRSSPSFWRPY